jgi:hypothetical protein
MYNSTVGLRKAVYDWFLSLLESVTFSCKMAWFSTIVAQSVVFLLSNTGVVYHWSIRQDFAMSNIELVNEEINVPVSENIIVNTLSDVNACKCLTDKKRNILSQNGLVFHNCSTICRFSSEQYWCCLS